MSRRYSIGRFEVCPTEREVRQDGEPMALGARAFDVLVALLERPGRLVTKDELLGLVWPGLVVEENNIQVQVSALRKLLGPQAIATVPGRGYRIAAEVLELDAVAPGQPSTKSPPRLPTDAVPPPAPAPALALPDRPSIAVLPFANLSGDPQQAYFTDGVTEDILTELARFHGLFVIARNSSFTYKNRAVDVRVVARELGVRYVLEGSIRRAGERIRVTAQLVDAIGGGQLWAERYDRQLQDVFEVQEEVTRAIVTAVAPHIEISESTRMRAERRVDLAPYEMAMQAWASALDGMSESRRDARAEAIRLSREALERDPRCSPALTTLAYALAWNVYFRTTEAPQADLEEALAMATRAALLDSGNHAAFREKGNLLCLTRRFDEGLRDMRRALELNPNDKLTLSLLGFWEAMNADAPAAIAHVTEALRLSPRDPTRYMLLNALGWAHYVAGDYAAAADAASRSVGDTPGFAPPHMCLAVCAVGRGDIEAARSHFADANRLAPELMAARLAGIWTSPHALFLERTRHWLRMAAGLEPWVPPTHP